MGTPVPVTTVHFVEISIWGPLDRKWRELSPEGTQTTENKSFKLSLLKHKDFGYTCTFKKNWTLEAVPKKTSWEQRTSPQYSKYSSCSWSTHYWLTIPCCALSLRLEVAILVEARLCFLMVQPPARRTESSRAATSQSLTPNLPRLKVRGSSALKLTLLIYSYKSEGRGVSRHTYFSEWMQSVLWLEKGERCGSDIILCNSSNKSIHCENVKHSLNDTHVKWPTSCIHNASGKPLRTRPGSKWRSLD